MISKYKNYWFIKWLILIYLIGFSACASERRVCPANLPDCDAFLVAPEVKNPRIEIESSLELKPSKGLWISGGERIKVRWDEFSVFINKQGVTCDFNNPGEGCERCNSCRTNLPFFCPLSEDQVISNLPDSSPLVQIHTFPGFMSQLPSTQTTNLNVETGCPASGFKITPTDNATYQLKLGSAYFYNVPVNEAASLTEAQVHLVKTGMETVMYELSSLSQDQSSDTLKFFDGKVPGIGGGKLQDNFSQRLSIGKVRILKGTPATDPATGSFLLENSSIVKPSRIVFIHNFLEGQRVFDRDRIRCYANYNLSDDGDFDLSQCRSGSNSNPTPLPATPVYLESNPSDLLTWVVEFNQNDFPAVGGGEMPTLGRGEVLAIEFTIK